MLKSSSNITLKLTETCFKTCIDVYSKFDWGTRTQKMACKQTAGCLLVLHQSLAQWCYRVEVPQLLQIDFVSLHPQFTFALKLQQHSNEKILNPSIMLLNMTNCVQLGWDLIVRKTTAYVYNIFMHVSIFKWPLVEIHWFYLVFLLYFILLPL